MNIKKNVPLHDKNWFQTGGPAEYFCEPSTLSELSQSLIYAHDHELPLTFIGEGANILISDEGIKGLVVRPAGKHCEVLSREKTHTLLDVQLDDDENYSYFSVESGCSLSDCIDFCLDNKLGGLEEFSGIPGTIGGATFINVHYFQFLLSDFVVGGYVLNVKTGTGEWVQKEWFDFGYDHSRLHAKEYYLGALIVKLRQLTSDEVHFARGRRAEIIRHRNHRYPVSHTCGSFFRNFHDYELIECRAVSKVKFVAYYLDVIGVKGTLSHGGARVSRHHANMIVNHHNATSNDIITLAQTMQEKVYTSFGIIPQPECQLLGFESYPLMTSVPEHTVERFDKKENEAH